MTVNPVHTADLAIFAVLALPTLYCLFRHGRQGILGWGFLFLFCTLRVVSGALATSNPKGEGGTILSSVALSPLLLAASGIVHEARLARNPACNRKVEWIIVIVIHMAVGGGIALAAVGISGIFNPESAHATNMTLLKAGLAILTVTWVSISIFGAASFATGGTAGRSRRPATVLLCATMFALIWIGVRVIYTLVAFTTMKPALNPITGTVTIQAVLELLPEVLSVVALVGAGIIDIPTIESSPTNNQSSRSRGRGPLAKDRNWSGSDRC